MQGGQRDHPSLAGFAKTSRPIVIPLLGFCQPLADNSLALLACGKQKQQYRRFVVRLREARQHAGLTQAEAARRLGRSQSFLAKCESGERRVDFVELLALADLYGVDDLEYFRP